MGNTFVAADALTIRGLVECSTGQTPGSPALLAPGRKALTYADLLGQMDQASAVLHSAGVHRGDRIALVVSNGPEAASGFLSIAEVAACAPLNPAYRPSEYSFYFSDLKPKAVVIERGIESAALDVAMQLDIPVIDLVPDLNGPAGTFSLEFDWPPIDYAESTTQPEDAALVLHTSGTTSRPKQVALTHANLCHSAANIRRALELTGADRCLNVMPLFHIHGLAAAVLSSLASGGSVVCTPGFYAPRILDWLSEFTPTWYTAVPTMHQAILSRAGDSAVATSLRFIRSCSAPLPPPLMAELERVFSVPVIEAYGMTEAAHQMACNPLPPGNRKAGSVGCATGPEIAIMQDGRVVPVGLTGEIVIRGPNVTSGYVGNAEATDAAFRDGWFHTGDLGWLDEESYLFISGRTKEMINRGGEKIAPREIDEALLEHPAVAQALAFPVPNSKLGEEPAVAVVFKPGMQAREAELREFVSIRLADFKVPRRIVIVDEIPKGATGKPNRLGLAAELGLNGHTEPTPTRTAQTRARRRPGTDSEKLVAGLWRQVLGRAGVNADDNFFELGGDSMLAALFLSRLAQAGRAAPTLLQLFDKPTVEGIADWLDSHDVPTTAQAPTREPNAPVPLSFAQQRFWFLDRYEEDAAAYVQNSAVRLRGPLDVDRLRRALAGVVARHEILRTTYETRDGIPHAVVGPSREIELPIVALESERDVHALAASQARLRFALARDLMIRPVLGRLAPDDHVLLLTRHHIASDGWSAEVLLRELATFYEGESLPESPIQYSDYARWQAQRYASGAFDQELAYWQERLAGSPSLLALPLDRPRPAKQTFQGARESFVLPATLVDALNHFSRGEGATLFMTLLAAFQALLYRYSGSEDLVVGCPVAGRGQVDLENIVGPVMNTLALRADLSADPAFRALLARTRESTLSALAHQELPFDKLVDVLRPARSLSHSPLFQVLFQLRNLPHSLARFADLQCEPFEADPGIAQFDLSLEFAPAAGQLHGALIYNTDLFQRETAARMVRHYRNLLEAVVRDPARPVSRVSILDEDERRQLLSGWNQTARPLPSQTVHEMFEAQAARSPNAMAVIDESGGLSYSELNSAAEQLAVQLREAGVGPGALAAICLERSRDMVVAVLAILKTGAAYLPLDPHYPAERIEFMLEDSGAAVVINSNGVEARRGISEIDSTAYAIYTSGSTGTPKAVLVSHSALANLLAAMRDELTLSERDSTVAVTTLAFDIAAAEIFLPLITGGTVAIANRTEQTDGRALRERIERVKPTWMQATPVTWKMLLNAGWNPNEKFTAISTGEAMPRPLADALLARCSRVFNLYGPAETTIWSTAERVRPGNGPVPIGRPIANTRVYVLDSHLEPMPVGVAGELYIAGAGVAQGYWNRPELTAERFLTDPFASEPGARMYKTEDQARWLPDGTLEYLGRRDGQVKLRGFRIELGEVEAVLGAHPEVRTATAAIREGALIAWCVWRSQPVETILLRKFLATRLPDYMIPSRFVTLEQIPSLPNGKVDRRALESIAEPPQPASAYVPPDDKTERKIAGIWEDLLSRRPVGRCDDFFECGGNSLLAARAAAHIERAFDIRLPVAALFEAPTITLLADYVRNGAEPSWPPRVIPIQPSGARVPFWAIGAGAAFRELAQQLGPDQPVLGVLLEDADMAALGPPYRVESIASAIVRIIQQQQPAGPYQLGGHSLQGLFALEVARQLEALGEEVRLLVLFDTLLPNAVRLKFPLSVRARVQLAAVWWLLSRGRVSDACGFAWRTMKDLIGRGCRTPVEPPPLPSSIGDVLRMASASYEPQPYGGTIVYFQAADQPIALHLGSRLGWAELAQGGFDLRIVPGGHANLLERPHAGAVAQALSTMLTRETSSHRVAAVAAD